jgi:hypothetical protein
MYRTLLHLQSAIRASLAKSPHRRIYHASLLACWPDLSVKARNERIQEFAAQNSWNVKLQEARGFGLVAEFSRADARDAESPVPARRAAEP